MGIKIGEDRRAKLVAALSASLDEIRIDSGYWPDRLSVFLATYEAREVLPQKGANREKLESLIDEDPLFEFVIEFLRAELSENRGYVHEEKNEPLSSIAGYEDMPALAAQIVSEIENLPRQYDVVFQLPSKLIPQEVLANRAFLLGNRASMTSPDLIFCDRYTLDHENPERASRARGGGVLNALMIGNPKWKEDSACLITKVDGYVGIYGGGAPWDDYLDFVESFLGLGLAKSLLSYQWKAINEKTTHKSHVFEASEEATSFYTTVNSSDEFSEVIRHLRDFDFPDNYPENQKIPWLKKVLDEMGSVFSHSDNERILLASKWFFESYKDTSPTLRYVRQMTCLEILLGSGFNIEKTSLGEMLSNRLAYLVGSNYAERQEILKEFKGIYGLRSRILHQGKHRMRQNERALLNKLTIFCRRAINAESRLLISE